MLIFAIVFFAISLCGGLFKAILCGQYAQMALYTVGIVAFLTIATNIPA